MCPGFDANNLSGQGRPELRDVDRADGRADAGLYLVDQLTSFGKSYQGRRRPIWFLFRHLSDSFCFSAGRSCPVSARTRDQPRTPEKGSRRNGAGTPPSPTTLRKVAARLKTINLDQADKIIVEHRLADRSARQLPRRHTRRMPALQQIARPAAARPERQLAAHGALNHSADGNELVPERR